MRQPPSRVFFGSPVAEQFSLTDNAATVITYNGDSP
jgi:hypothetical protein